MRRRRFIGLCGIAAAGLAGCANPTDDAGDGNGSPTPGTEPTPTEPPADAPTLRAEHEWLQPALVTMNVDALSVDGESGRQYLYLGVAVEAGDAPARSALRLRFDGETYPPAAPDRLYRTYPEDDGQYRAERGEGWVLFDLPATGDASDLALLDESSGTEWPVTSQASTNLDGRLAAPAPSLSLDVTVPETVTVEEQPTVSLTVMNEGDRDGTFVGGVNRQGPAIASTPIETVRGVVPPGESTTLEVTDTVGYSQVPAGATGDGEADMTYHVEWSGGTRSGDVRLVESSADS